MEQTEGGQTILYINQYYEKNLTTGVVTTSYYLGGQLIAAREGTTLRYVHQDSLSSTSVMSTSTGTFDSSMTFFPFGLTRTGSVSTDKKFTGQRLDGTGLYYYGARYYDASIGRFISPDTVVQNLYDPQSLNRYTYCVNNPLIYTDPSGSIVEFANEDTCLNWINQALNNGENISDSLWAMIQEWAKLRCAWSELSTVVPELTSYLQDRPETIVMCSVDLSSKNESGFTVAAAGVGGAILIDTGTIDMGINVTTAILGHEALHAACELNRKGFTLPSLAEEALCYNMQYYLDMTLTGSCNNDLAVACQDVNPWLGISYLGDQLNGGIAKTLRGKGYGFPNTLWPTGPAFSPRETLIQTAKKFWRCVPILQPFPWIR